MLDQKIDDDQRAGVDHRISWNPALVFELDQRIERIAGRLSPDAFPDLAPDRTFAADLLHRQYQREDFGHALNRECNIDVADHVFSTVQFYDGEPEQVRVEFAKLRNVVSHLSARCGRPGGVRSGLDCF